VPFDDLLKLKKTPSRLRIGFGKNNNYYPTEVENRLLDVRWLGCILVVKESSEPSSSVDKQVSLDKHSFVFRFVVS